MLVTNPLIKDPRVQRELNSAQQSGFEVIFIGSQNEFYNKEFLNKLPFITDIILFNEKIRKSRFIFSRVYRAVYRFWSFVFKTAKYKPDIIHCNDLSTLPQGYIASKICNAKVVYDSHEINCDVLSEKKSMSEKIMILVESFLIRRVDRVVSVSNAASKIISDYYKIPPPTVVTNCSFKVENVNLNIIKKDFKVLYHGIMSQDRGYEEFILSSEKVKPGIILQLRGYGPLENLLREKTKSLNLVNIVFEKPVEINELIIKASESNVGVVLTKPVNTNYKYTVGNKIFEYINAGLPVILSRVPEHIYLNEKFNIGIVVDVNPKEIAEAINRLYEDEKLYHELRRNAIEMSKIMCWENEVLKLIEIYKELSTCK